MNPIISIITPVYNAGKYLHKCIDGIVGQSFANWELLLVDDGSTDNSARICDEYASSDSRIRVIHKANGGVSAARQTGLDAARGEYVIHADADDWVERNMLEELYKKAKETDVDVVICDYYVNDSNNERYVTQCPSSLDAQTVLGELFQYLIGSCWNKLVRRDCYSRYGIRFPEGINYCEDLLTWIMLFKHDDVKVAYLPMAFYHYWMNENSITHRLTRANYEGLLKYLKCLNEVLPEDKYQVLKDKASLSVFAEGFMGNVMTRDETKNMFKQVRYTAYHSKRGIRWKIGYLLIDLGLYGLAHLFIKY